MPKQVLPRNGWPTTIGFHLQVELGGGFGLNLNLPETNLVNIALLIGGSLHIQAM